MINSCDVAEKGEHCMKQNNETKTEGGRDEEGHDGKSNSCAV